MELRSILCERHSSENNLSHHLYSRKTGNLPRSHSFISLPQFVQAHHAYFSTIATPHIALHFPKGAMVEILRRVDSGWLYGCYNHLYGWFPSSCVSLINTNHSHDNPTRLRRGSQGHSDMTYEAMNNLDEIVSPSNQGDRPNTQNSHFIPQLHKLIDYSISQQDSIDDFVTQTPLERQIKDLHSTDTINNRKRPREPSGVLWEEQIEALSQEIFLLDTSQPYPVIGLHTAIFDVVSSIRDMIRSIDDTETTCPDTLKQQKKVVLHVLSRVVQKGTSETNYLAELHYLRAIVNRLWVEALLLENLIKEKEHGMVQSWISQRLQSYQIDINELITVGLTAIEDYVTLQKSPEQVSKAEQFQTLHSTQTEAIDQSKEAIHQAIHHLTSAIDTLPPQLQAVFIKACEDHKQTGNRWSTASTLVSENTKLNSTNELPLKENKDLQQIPDPDPDPDLTLSEDARALPGEKEATNSWLNNRNHPSSGLYSSMSPERQNITFDSELKATSSTPLSKSSRKISATHTKALSTSNVESLMKISNSLSTPLSNQKKKTHRPRGLSVSSIRMSLKSQHHDTSQPASPPLTYSSESLRSRLSASFGLRRTHFDYPEKNEALAPTDIASRNKEIKLETDTMLRYQFNRDTYVTCNAGGQILGATPKALIEIMTAYDFVPDQSFYAAFFYNFRVFMSPCTLVELLIERFHAKPPSKEGSTLWPLEDLIHWEERAVLLIRLGVYRAIKLWLQDYYDPENDVSARDSLICFAQGEMAQCLPKHYEHMLKLIEKRQREQSEFMPPSPITSKTLKRSFIYTTLSNDHSSLSNVYTPYPTPNIARPLRNALHPQELARQLTLMENAMFCDIQPKEILAAQESQKHLDPAIHVKAMIHRSTHLVYWISNTVLDEPDIKKRAHIIKYWIKVGDYCLQLNNFNSLMAVRCAFNSASIARLKLTWEIVYKSTKHKTMLDTAYKIADSQRNFTFYRKCLRNANAPCLPFLGIYLSDMVFIDQGNPDYRNSHSAPYQQLINFDKYIRIGRILTEVISFQVPYKLKPITDIQRYLLQCLDMEVETEETTIYSKSLQVEPKYSENTTHV
ncbi:ras guanine nucleotide exchange factor domain-containing protein [Spinellus fusiger]|nr:ras guanine nucleotide exchange factor domain-containing protein [Spinellus fusiger]